ncbi:ABC-three component system protein [Burkholderia cepacia]
MNQRFPSKDREGMCHQMANEERLDWCNP